MDCCARGIVSPLGVVLGKEKGVRSTESCIDPGVGFASK